MEDKDVEYYRHRAATERALAASSDRQEVAAIHEELAEQYQTLVENASLRPRLSLSFGQSKLSA